MNCIYIPETNQVINLDHVVDAKFEPAYHREAGTDEFGESYPERDIKARLTITTTALQLEELSNYEGDTKGTASTSQVVTLSGNPAERVWAYLTDDMAYKV